MSQYLGLRRPASGERKVKRTATNFGHLSCLFAVQTLGRQKLLKGHSEAPLLVPVTLNLTPDEFRTQWEDSCPFCDV